MGYTLILTNKEAFEYTTKKDAIFIIMDNPVDTNIDTLQYTLKKNNLPNLIYFYPNITSRTFSIKEHPSYYSSDLLTLVDTMYNYVIDNKESVLSEDFEWTVSPEVTQQETVIINWYMYRIQHIIDFRGEYTHERI